MMTRLLSLLLVLFVFSLTANASKDLEWQKIDLEDKIDFIYNKHLTSQFKASEFIVKTKVQYNNPGMPKFEDLNKDSIKVSDVAFDDSKGDYIAFSKVGLEVPIVGKYFQENQTKLKELYRFNESYDLFKNIEAIGVDITLSDKLNEQQVAIAKNIVNSIEILFGDIKPQISFKVAEIDYVPPKSLEGEKPKVPDPVGFKEILEFLGKFGNALGMILAVILFGILAMKLLNKYLDAQASMKRQEERHNKNEDITENDENGEGEGENAEEADPVYTIERFEKLLEHNLDQAVVLVKKWVKENGKNFELALTALAQQLKTQDLEKLFTALTSQEREGWTQNIHEFLTPAQLQESNQFITEEIVRELIGGSFIEDFDVVDMILQMDINSVKGFISENEVFGAYLLNLLNSNMVSKVFKEVNPQEVQRYISASLAVDPKEITKNQAQFKSALQTYTSRTKLTPFNFKIQKIVGDVTPDKEEVLYNFIAQQGNRELLVDTAKKNIPGKLIFDLSQEIIKAILQDYPMEKKVEFITVLEDEHRDTVMNCYPKGSNGREMLEMELETIEADDLKVQRLRRQSDNIWKDFISFSRQVLSGNDEFASSVDLVIQSWADDMLGDFVQTIRKPSGQTRVSNINDLKDGDTQEFEGQFDDLSDDDSDQEAA